MRIAYDPAVDALSITFRETTVTTKHLAERITADYDAADFFSPRPKRSVSIRRYLQNRQV